MERLTSSSRVIRVGKFELKPRTGELSGGAKPVQLTIQPLQVLLVLLEHPGELVTREELIRRVWSSDTFVDFDHGLNKAVNRLREALGDSAEKPKYIETLPRRGYRLLAQVEAAEEAEIVTPPVPEVAEMLAVGAKSSLEEVHGTATRQAEAEVPASSRRYVWVALGATAAIALLVISTGRIGNFLNHAKPVKPEIESLAVLPLENLSGDPEQSYFADGMTDALITEVAKIGATRVISRTSVMRYKGTRQPVQQVARELNVDAIVEGTVQQAGKRIRITAQLIQASTDMHLWAESFERDASEVLTLQQDVATQIARRVGSVVNEAAPHGTVNPEAYGEYLKGRYYFSQYTADGWQKAIEHFSRSIEFDPNFAPAHAGLAQSYLVASGWNMFPPDEALRHGQDEARKALTLDGSLASSHLAMGVVYDLLYDRNKAEKEFARGLELNPNDSLAWQQHGNHLLSEGKFQEAISEQEHALQLDPLSPMIKANLARAFYYSRQYDQAIAEAQSCLKLEPNYPVALRWLERAYRKKGMLAEGYAALLAGSKPEERVEMERVYRASGYRGVLHLQAERYVQNGSLVEAARMYAQSSDPTKAMELLEENARRGWPGLSRLKIDPDFDPLRENVRFQQLMRGAGLE